MNEKFKTKEVLALSARICDAVAKDEQAEGCDISAGLFGPSFSELVVELAACKHAADKLKTVLTGLPELLEEVSEHLQGLPTEHMGRQPAADELVGFGGMLREVLWRDS